MKSGKVFLVGAGPGDAKLITVYGLECIKKADVIVYDRLIKEELLHFAKPTVELIFCGKFPGNHTMVQDRINSILVKKACEGNIVTRLKGGDPFVFGRGGEEAAILAENSIPYEIVPGVTSSIAASAYAGIPVTHRGYASSFAMITGHGHLYKEPDKINWRALATGIDTLAFYMGIRNLDYICEQLINNGRKADTPTAVIEWGTTEYQRTVTGTLETIHSKVEKEQITNPAIILVGNVVQLRKQLKWFEEAKLNEPIPVFLQE